MLVARENVITDCRFLLVARKNVVTDSGDFVLAVDRLIFTVKVCRSYFEIFDPKNGCDVNLETFEKRVDICRLTTSDSDFDMVCCYFVGNECGFLSPCLSRLPDSFNFIFRMNNAWHEQCVRLDLRLDDLRFGLV